METILFIELSYLGKNIKIKTSKASQNTDLATR